MIKSANNFLIELTRLTQKYQIKIDSCGCCGGIILCSMSNDEKHMSHMIYFEDKNSYEICENCWD